VVEKMTFPLHKKRFSKFPEAETSSYEWLKKTLRQAQCIALTPEAETSATN